MSSRQPTPESTQPSMPAEFLEPVTSHEDRAAEWRLRAENVGGWVGRLLLVPLYTTGARFHDRRAESARQHIHEQIEPYRLARWYAPSEGLYRRAITNSARIADSADLAHELEADFGRTPEEAYVHATRNSGRSKIARLVERCAIVLGNQEPGQTEQFILATRIKNFSQTREALAVLGAPEEVLWGVGDVPADKSKLRELAWSDLKEASGYGGRIIAAFEDPSGRLDITVKYHPSYETGHGEEHSYKPNRVEFTLTNHRYSPPVHAAN